MLLPFWALRSKELQYFPHPPRPPVVMRILGIVIVEPWHLLQSLDDYDECFHYLSSYGVILIF